MAAMPSLLAADETITANSSLAATTSPFGSGLSRKTKRHNDKDAQSENGKQNRSTRRRIRMQCRKRSSEARRVGYFLRGGKVHGPSSIMDYNTGHALFSDVGLG